MKMQQNLYKNFHHIRSVLLHCLVKCKHSKMTNCAHITIMAYRVEVPHTFNQLSMLSQNLL